MKKKSAVSLTPSGASRGSAKSAKSAKSAGAKSRQTVGSKRKSQTGTLHSHTGTLASGDRHINFGNEAADEEDKFWFVNTFKRVFQVHVISLSVWCVVIITIMYMVYAAVFTQSGIPTVDRGHAQHERNWSALAPTWGPIPWITFSEWTLIFYDNFVMLFVMYCLLFLIGLEVYHGMGVYRSRTMIKYLALYALLCVITIVLELHIKLTLTYPGNDAFLFAKKVMLTDIVKHYGIAKENGFTCGFNIIMIHFQCCGMDGPDDFSYLNLTVDFSEDMKDTFKYAPPPDDQYFYYPGKYTSAPFLIPPVCCKNKFFSEGTLEEQFHAQAECAISSYDEETANLKGCSQVVFELIQSVWVWINLYLVVSIYLTSSVAFMCMLRLLQHFDF